MPFIALEYLGICCSSNPPELVPLQQGHLSVQSGTTVGLLSAPEQLFGT